MRGVEVSRGQERSEQDRRREGQSGGAEVEAQRQNRGAETELARAVGTLARGNGFNGFGSDSVHSLTLGGRLCVLTANVGVGQGILRQQLQREKARVSQEPK
eukprot:1058114-Rhodomonas_salina.1